MSTTVPVPYSSAFGAMVGRGQVEAHILATISDWIVTYIAEYERAYDILPRSTPVPPTPESIHGGIDFETWESALAPEIIVVAQPSGAPERFPDFGYGQTFRVEVGAVVYVEGDQDGARALADIYGAALQLLLIQQGGFGIAANGVDTFATRTRLANAGAASFLDVTVRDIAREIVSIDTFVVGLGDDLAGPRVPPADPYATPLPWPPAAVVEITTTGETPAGVPGRTDGVTIDGRVVPPVITYD